MKVMKHPAAYAKKWTIVAILRLSIVMLRAIVANIIKFYDFSAFSINFKTFFKVKVKCEADET